MLLSINNLNVMIAMPVAGQLPPLTAMSLIETVQYLERRRMLYRIEMCLGNSIVQLARSNLANVFLASPCDRLFWIDSDMRWSAAAFLRLLELSTVCPVVGASYPRKSDPLAFIIDTANQTKIRSNEYGCIQIGGFGLGFTVVQRSVMEALAAKAAKIIDDDGQILPMIFHAGVQDGSFVGEDMNFFRDCRAVGAETWCDPAIQLGHIGTHEWAGSLSQTMRMAGHRGRNENATSTE